MSPARYLEEAFPGSQVEKLKTELIELDRAANKRGRPREYCSSQERQRAYRQRRKESEQHTSLQQKSFPYVGKNSCDDKELLDERYENTIGIYTHFVTQADVHGTVYRDKISNTERRYLLGGNVEDFVGVLEDFHSQTMENKEANFLISPAIFDPAQAKRGLHNIVAMRHLWMDFEKGDLRPEGIPELFPHIRLVVFNTYNHTSENPRFRVVIPFDYPIPPENYVALYNNVIAKIEDAGYSVGKAKGGLRSGLDVSKKTPTSLFYLPCQAKETSDSFFHDYNDERKIFDPMTWIKNTVVPFPPVDDARRNIQQTSPKKVDQAAVERATMIWRESPKYPHEGNDRFFDFAVSLRSAGMSLNDIELKLRDEAGFGRTPHERRAQIPSIMKTLRASLKKSA